MKQLDVSIPELFFVAATRGMAGAGLGLLASNYMAPETRRHVGWTLLGIGVLTTAPILATVVARALHPQLAD
jgi:multisubunit Na+/H+ antiporter MnhG subunit